MLNFNVEMESVLDKVRTACEQQPFIQIDYPLAIDKDTWEFHEDDILIPKLKGTLYFIYDEDKTLLYIGKTKALCAAVRSHLKRRSSMSVKSILSEIKEKVSNGKKKCVYIKVIDIQPTELASTIKPYLVKEYSPELVKRLS